jgi:hypothetical protein
VEEESMGKADRERRKAKEKESKRQRQNRPGPSGGSWGFPGWAGGPAPEEVVAEWLAAAMEAQAQDDDERFRRCVEALAQDRGLRREVDLSLLDMLQRQVTFAWREGWQPADVVRLVSRGSGARHVRRAARPARTGRRAVGWGSTRRTKDPRRSC